MSDQLLQSVFLNRLGQIGFNEKMKRFQMRPIHFNQQVRRRVFFNRKRHAADVFEGAVDGREVAGDHRLAALGVGLLDEALDAGDDQAGVDLVQHLGAEAEPFGDTGAKPLDQHIGAIAMGVGQILKEDISFDGDGQLVTGSFMDYAMPRADDFPMFNIDTICTPLPRFTTWTPFSRRSLRKL